MATYTAFLGNLRPAPVYSPDSGATPYITPASCDVLVLDSNSRPIAPDGYPPESAACTVANYQNPIVTSDSVATLRAKLLTVVRAMWAGSVKSNDTLRVIWLDDGGLLSL